MIVLDHQDILYYNLSLADVWFVMMMILQLLQNIQLEFSKDN